MNWASFTAAESGRLLPEKIAAAIPMFAAGIGRPALLAEETDSVRATFQDAITTDPKNTLPDDPALLPASCIGDAATILAFRLVNLMLGSTYAPTIAVVPPGLQTQFIRADMTLREMRLGHFSSRDREIIPPPIYIPGPVNDAIP